MSLTRRIFSLSFLLVAAMLAYGATVATAAPSANCDKGNVAVRAAHNKHCAPSAPTNGPMQFTVTGSALDQMPHFDITMRMDTQQIGIRIFNPATPEGEYNALNGTTIISWTANAITVQLRPEYAGFTVVEALDHNGQPLTFSGGAPLAL